MVIYVENPVENKSKITRKYFEFCMVTGHSQLTIVFIHNDNTELENETKALFIIVSKHQLSMKKLTKYIQDLYTKSCKTLLRKIKADLSKWRAILCLLIQLRWHFSWNGLIGSVEVPARLFNLLKKIILFLVALGLHCCTWVFSSFGEQASHRGGASVADTGSRLEDVSSCSRRAEMCRLSGCGARASQLLLLLRGIWNLPRPGIKSTSPALAGRFSPIVPPGKSPARLFKT